MSSIHKGVLGEQVQLMEVLTRNFKDVLLTAWCPTPKKGFRDSASMSGRFWQQLDASVRNVRADGETQHGAWKPLGVGSVKLFVSDLLCSTHSKQLISSSELQNAVCLSKTFKML